METQTVPNVDSPIQEDPRKGAYEFTKKFAKVQQELKAPKGQTNAFGRYKYRSCEDILEAVKPLLGDLILTLSDEIVQVGDRFYVKATARISDGVLSFANTAWARETLDRKGMDESQITGSSSSYARKYALNGLFLIDDTKDADTQDNTKIERKSPVQQTPRPMFNQNYSKPIK